MSQLQHDLGQLTDPGRRLAMADIGLDRTDRAELFLLCIRLVGVDQPLNLDRISKRSPRAVRLDIADGLGVYPGPFQRHPNRPCLGNGIWHRVSLRTTVLADSGSLDHGQNSIPIGLRICQWFQQDNANRFTGNQTVAIGGKGVAMPPG